MRTRTWLLGIAAGLLMAAAGLAADFPARTFFNARGVMETPFGKFFTGLPAATAGRSAYCPIANTSVSSLPPFGSTYGAELAPTFLYSVDDPKGPAVARILRIAHLVEGSLQEAADFPGPGIDSFKSTFINGEVEILVGPLAGRRIFLPTMVDPVQEVSRSAPFFDGGRSANDQSVLPVPPGSNLPTSVSDADIDFFVGNMNGTGEKTIHLQIVSLDARSADGRFRIISGRQMLQEYPALFTPSFGIVVSNSGQRAVAARK